MGKDASGKQQGQARGSVTSQQLLAGKSSAAQNGAVQDFVAIARVARPQGRKGEVIAEILTDFPARFADLQRVFVDDPGEGRKAVTIERIWLHKGRVVLKLAGIDSINDAETLRGRYVLIPAEEKVVLPSNQYYLWELTGCQVVVEHAGERKPLGVVTEVERTGGVDLLHIRDGSEEILIPFAQSICKVIDPEARLIVVEPPEDLLDLNRKQEA